MNSVGSGLLAIVTLHLLLLPPLSSCTSQPQEPPFSPRGLFFAEKSRLGSTPPSCHNKCNQCHPCMAVQVPSMPSHQGDRPGLARTYGPMRFFDPAPRGDGYSNYKPLGWKCSCGNHFFNP